MGLCASAPANSGDEYVPKPVPISKAVRKSTHMLLSARARGGSKHSLRLDDDDDKDDFPEVSDTDLTDRKKSEPSRVENAPFTVGDSKYSYVASLYPGFTYMKRKNCEDAYMTTELKTKLGTYRLFCVFDGHGQFGARVSKKLTAITPDLLKARMDEAAGSKDTVDWGKMFRVAFRDIDRVLKKEPMFLSLSGSTGTMLLLGEDEAHVAHVGDSQAALCYEQGKELMAQSLTRPHNFEDPLEADRARKVGGQIKRAFPNAKTKEEGGPLRVYQRNSTGPGLAVSRGFGDLQAKKVGVLVDPEYKYIKLDDSHKFFVLASDGVWDHMDIDEAVCFVHLQGDDPRAGRAVVMQCAERWIDRTEGMCDDISFIAVFLQEPQPMATPSRASLSRTLDSPMPSPSLGARSAGPSTPSFTSRGPATPSVSLSSRKSRTPRANSTTSKSTNGHKRSKSGGKRRTPRSKNRKNP